MPQPTRLGWDPARTWVFAVGLLEWQHDDVFTPFPRDNRRDAQLVALLRTLGIPPAHVAYLQDKQATTRAIQQAFEAHLAKAAPGDLLIVYFCGHGDRTEDGGAYFASYDCDGAKRAGWLVDTIPATVERHFKGDRALLLADCCCSGSLIDAARTHGKRVGFACLASSLANETSTGNWTFTEELLSGLGGNAFVDADGDAAITLAELAKQITDSMAFAEEQIATFGTTRGFDTSMVLAAAQPRPDQRVGRRVAVLSEKTWYRAQIVAARAEQVRVHYYGYESSDDEWLPEARTRALARPSYPVGAAVEVRWKQKWYPAAVLEVRASIHLIKYEDFGAEWNEWVPLDRIRPLA